jgi:hypothetical protein
MLVKTIRKFTAIYIQVKNWASETGGQPPSIRWKTLKDIKTKPIPMLHLFLKKG